MAETKERVNFTLSKKTKQQLEAAIPKSKRSGFVEDLIANALKDKAKRELVDHLDSLKRFSTNGKDSMETLRKLRRERTDYLISRHETDE